MFRRLDDFGPFGRFVAHDVRHLGRTRRVLLLRPKLHRQVAKDARWVNSFTTKAAKERRNNTQNSDSSRSKEPPKRAKPHRSTGSDQLENDGVSTGTFVTSVHLLGFSDFVCVSLRGFVFFVVKLFAFLRGFVSLAVRLFLLRSLRFLRSRLPRRPCKGRTLCCIP